MTVGEALDTLGKMVSATSSTLKDIISLVVGAQEGPKIIKCDVITVHLIVERSAREGSDSIVGVATDGVLVVTVVLGEGLLEDGTPDALIFRDLGEESGVAAFNPPSLSKRQVVIDDDRVRHTEGEEVQGVDAVSADGIVVEENLLHAAWDFSEDGSTRDEPAVADKALTHIFVLDASGTEERVISRVDFCDSLPIDIWSHSGHVAIALAH